VEGERIVLDVRVDEDGRMVMPEGKTREYKLNLDNTERVLKSVVAFANSAGGELVIGVRDDRTVVGVDDPLIEQERLSHVIADSVRPQLAPVIDLVTVEDKTLLVAVVTLGSQRPYHLKSVGPYQGTFYRTGAENRQAGPNMVNELSRSARDRTYDQLPCAGATLADLDMDALSALFGRLVDENTLRTLELTCEEQGQVVPTNGGILVGCPHPERFMPFAWVQCARFRGSSLRNITDQREIHGPLPLAVDQVMHFLKANAFLSADFVSGPRRREDVWSIPLDALKELVVNALVHSSYAGHGTPIKVAFFDDRIWIESPGGLNPGVTIDLMKQGVSVIRNPVLARVFKELSLVERWGTGIPRVLATLAEAGLPEPEFEESVERLRTTVFVANHDPRLFDPARKPPAVAATASAESPTELVTPPSVDVSMSGVQVSMYARQMLRVAQDGPARRADLLRAAGLSQSPTNRARHIQPLVAAGLLELSVPDAPRSSKQRYLITDAGRQFLAQDERDGVR